MDWKAALLNRYGNADRSATKCILDKVKKSDDYKTADDRKIVCRT